MLAVCFRLSCLLQSCLLLYYSNRRNRRNELAEGLVTALLKAEQHLAQRLLYVLLHKEDAVEMVGHQLKGQHVYLWVAQGYLMPTLLHAPPQLSGLRTRCFWRAWKPVTLSHDLP